MRGCAARGAVVAHVVARARCLVRAGHAMGVTAPPPPRELTRAARPARTQAREICHGDAGAIYGRQGRQGKPVAGGGRRRGRVLRGLVGCCARPSRVAGRDSRETHIVLWHRARTRGRVSREHGCGSRGAARGGDGTARPRARANCKRTHENPEATRVAARMFRTGARIFRTGSRQLPPLSLLLALNAPPPKLDRPG